MSVPPANTLPETLYSAVRYALDRVQTDPDFRYHMSGTETLDRLIKAEAAFLGRPEEEVREKRQADLQPKHRRREAACALNHDRVRELERLLERNGIDVPDRR
jgi:hypothetical protein